jgi:predicted  nucleic acid-binding Zn-ribbon protein
MRQISFQIKMEALDLYLQGFSANEIVTKTGISKGTIISILKDAREGRFPGLELKERIDELHSLSVRLKKERVDLSQAKLGFSFFKRLLDMDIEPDRIKEWVDFCSEISPSPPEGFIPAAMELLNIEKETGKTYAEIAFEVKELSSQREKLINEVGDLHTKEMRARELKDEIENNSKEIERLSTEKSKLESMVDSLNSFLEKRAKEMGIPLSDLVERLGQFISLGEEIVSKSGEKNKIKGELEALRERQEKLSSQMEKASSDFGRDIKLIRETRNELAQIAQIKGKYEQEVEYMEWAKRVLPFLSDPDKVDDEDFSLASIIVNCLDKWIQAQPQWRFGSFGLRWDEVKRHAYSKRTELR